jgi:peptidoglycan/LPS O-acetylase OafA/YrhL
LTHFKGETALDLRDGNVLKGLAILAIVFHNYFHLLPNAATENEFDFATDRFHYFLATVRDPQQAIQAVFSYLGHFGVQIFIFLSAYGLAVKHWEIRSWRGFLWSRIRKIYPTFFLALALFLLLKVVQDGPHEFAAYMQVQGNELVLTTLAVSTLLPGYGLPPVGPWWFLPFIIQFYCIWSLLAAFTRRFGGRGLFLLSVAGLAVTVAAMPVLGKYGITLLTTPIGHLPEIALGIAVARCGMSVRPVLAVALVAFLIGNLNFWVWPTTYTSILLLMLGGYAIAGRWLRGRRALVWLGQISMPLFFVNGFLRGPFWPLGRSGIWYLQLVGGLAFAATSVAVAYVLWLTERWIMSHASWRREPQVEPAA